MANVLRSQTLTERSWSERRWTALPKTIERQHVPTENLQFHRAKLHQLRSTSHLSARLLRGDFFFSPRQVAAPVYLRVHPGTQPKRHRETTSARWCWVSRFQLARTPTLQKYMKTENNMYRLRDFGKFVVLVSK